MEVPTTPNLFFPTLNAVLNGISGLLLVWGWFAIRKPDRELHKKVMLSAFGVSAAFLGFYLYYHFNDPSVRYKGSPTMRSLDVLVLVPHIVLATLNLPFILRTIQLALKGRYQEHARLARWVWPIWTYVSVTGVLVYLMLYVWADPNHAPHSTPSISDLIPKEQSSK